jgi:hypothetical protein
MRRLICIFSILLLLCFSAGCSGEKTMDIDAFCRDVLETVSYDDELIRLSDRVVGDYYDLSFDGLEEYAIYVSATSATANELAVMKLADAKAVEAAKAAVKARIDTQTANYENYRPDELFRLENALVTEKNNYLLFSASPTTMRSNRCLTKASNNSAVCAREDCGMIFECSAIILVILIMSYLIFRSGNGYGWGIGVLPLTLVPAAHIVGVHFSYWLSRPLRVEPMIARVGVDVIALVETCCCWAPSRRRMKRNAVALDHLVTCGGFSAILTCVLLARTIL